MDNCKTKILSYAFHDQKNFITYYFYINVNNIALMNASLLFFAMKIMLARITTSLVELHNNKGLFLDPNFTSLYDATNVAYLPLHRLYV